MTLSPANARLRQGAAAATSKGSMPDVGDIRSDNWLRKQSRREDVEHLIKDGKLLSLYYDFEATGLKHMFEAPTQFCGIIKDVTGRIIHDVKIDIQVPEDTPLSPNAAIVTQAKPRELYDAKNRVPPHIAAAVIADFFQNPYRFLWDKLESTATKDTGAGEEVRVYTLDDPDPSKKVEIRLHKGGKNISFRYQDRVDDLCDLMVGMQAKQRPLADAIAGVLGVNVNEIFDADDKTLIKDKIELGIRKFDGGTDTFLTALQQKMGKDYPPPIYNFPKVERFPDTIRDYRDPDKRRWREIAAPAMTKGHNIKRFDDRLLWSFLHRQMNDKVFLTHIKDDHRFRVDTLELARLVALLDKGKGEEGFKAGKKPDPKNKKRMIDSFSLSSLMIENSHDYNDDRGLHEGIRMPDGSKYKPELAHRDARYDVLATIALDTYMRRRAPDVVKMVENNADFDRIKSFLIGYEGLDQPHPVLAFVRSVYEHRAHLHFGVCVGINEEIHERRQAVMVRTDHGLLKNYTYDGKPLLEMTVDELKQMIEEERNKANALCEVIDLRKNPPVVPAEMSARYTKGRNIKKNQENETFLRNHKDFCERLIDAHALAMPPMPNYRSVNGVPQPEDHLFTHLETKQYELTPGVLLKNAVHKEWAEKALPQARKIDNAYRRAVKPHAVEIEEFYRRTYNKHYQDKYETRLAMLDDLIDELKKADEHLVDTHPGYISGASKRSVQHPFKMLPEPDHPFDWHRRKHTIRNPETGRNQSVSREPAEDELDQDIFNATEYKWKLRAELGSKFNDKTQRFTVQDLRNNGHDIPFHTLNAMNDGDIADRLREEDYDINMEHHNASGELVARMFRDAGRIKWVTDYWRNKPKCDDAEHEFVRRKNLFSWENPMGWKAYFEALRALRYHGAPDLDHKDQRWTTWLAGLKRDVRRIEDNLESGGYLRATTEKLGDFDIFIKNREDAEKILIEWKELAQELLDQNPLTSEKALLVGYDLQRQAPIEDVQYKVHGKILTIDVPDRVLENTLNHHDVAHQFILFAPTPEQRRALTEAKKEGAFSVFFRGEQSGRTYYAAKWIWRPLEKVQPRQNFDPIYEDAERLYANSGVKPPPRDKFLSIAMEALEPVPSEVDLEPKAIKIRRWNDFMSLVNPALGNREGKPKLTRIIIKDLGSEAPIPGKTARLQGMVKDGQSESGWEVRAMVKGVMGDSNEPLTLDDALERIKVGRSQDKAAHALGEKSVEDLRDKLTSITQEQITHMDETTKRSLRVRNLQSLRILMDAKSFTPHYAITCGAEGLDSLENRFRDLFARDEQNANPEQNCIQIIEVEPAQKTDMCYYSQGRRPMIKVDENAQHITLPPIEEQKPHAPDPSTVRGDPDIQRGRAKQLEKT